MPKISVIVPVYKVESYIHRCIDSILAQTFSDFELILVDDGSPDNCPKICDEYAEKDSRIKVIHKENGGLSSARNAGIDYMFQNSNSEYVAFIDSDDWIHPQYLEILFSGIKENNADISCCRLKITENFEKSELLNGIQADLKTPEFLWVNIFPVSACCKIYKRDLFDNIRYPIGKLCEDSFTTHKVFFKVDKVAFFQEELYYYYTNPNSIMNSKWSLRRLDEYKSYFAQIEYFAEHGYEEARKMSVDRCLYQLYFAIENLTKFYPDEKKLIRETRNIFRKTLKKYKIEIDIKHCSDKNAFLRTAYPIESNVKKFISKKIKSIIYRIKKLLKRV